MRHVGPQRDPSGRRIGRTARLAAAGILLLQVGGDCTKEPEPPPPGVVAPQLSITLNAVPPDMNGLLVVPRSGFVVNVAIAPGTHPIDRSLFLVYVDQWGGVYNKLVPGIRLSADGSSAVGLFPDLGLGIGSFTLNAAVPDTDGNWGFASIPFAMRDFPTGSAPIGTGQKIWLDFASDRDAVAGPDFPVDLEHFGLGSPGAPALSAVVEARVVEAVLDRLAGIYHAADGNGLGAPDPVQVDFFADPPGGDDVTRICVGGQDPSGGWTIGNIQIDPGNANRSSTECATIPPTGIFPRELLWFSGQAAFQQAIDPLRPAAGGTAVGQDPLDATVLDPGFDPETASPEALARHQEIEAAIAAFANALATIIGHETGHALGLVPGGPPGGGLYGGTSGAASSHDVTPSGANPTGNFVMNAGSTFTFARLAGLAGEPLAAFRALDFAYLRDRAVVDAKVTGLYFPPTATSVSPTTVPPGTNTLLTVQGADFRATPSMRIENGAFVAQLQGESFVSANEVRGWVLPSQALPGTYDLVVENPDGQTARLAQAVTLAAP
jgi:hypothetical protein